MKKLFRIISLTLCAAVALGLSACTGAGENNQTEPETVRVTFPEGSTAVEIARLLSDNGVCGFDEFLAAVNDPEQGGDFSGTVTNSQERPFLWEGYLFPDTYDFYVGEGAQRALARFISNMDSKLGDEDYKRAEELGYTMDEILALASIIQKEALDKESSELVSSVLHNRLNSDAYPRLQCDATIFYLNRSVEPYVEGGEKYEEFYSTYICKGLPAGPIANPGVEAINAALYPASSSYYFFVTDSQGNYYYAETYEEHLKNCDRAGLER